MEPIQADWNTHGFTEEDLRFIHPQLWPLARPIDILTLDPANARVGHDIPGIAASIKLYKQRTPVVVNVSEANKVEKGNGTTTAMLSIDSPAIAVIEVQDDPATAAGYSLVDNRLGDASHFDYMTMNTIFDALRESEVEPSELPGFNLDFVTMVFDAVHPQEPDAPDEFPEFDEDLDVDYRCPSCGYEWSGSAT